MNIEYKDLKFEDCSRIREIDCSQYIARAWREVDGKRQLVTIDWNEPDFPNGFEHHLAGLQNTIKGNGIAIGAFLEGRLIGYCTVNPEFFGEKSRYLLLDQLFISRESRGQGIGKALFMMVAERVKQRGADKLYICAGSAENTISFYFAIGCTEAAEINQALFDQDPRDYQLEFVLK